MFIKWVKNKFFTVLSTAVPNSNEWESNSGKHMAFLTAAVSIELKQSLLQSYLVSFFFFLKDITKFFSASSVQFFLFFYLFLYFLHTVCLHFL